MYIEHKTDQSDRGYAWIDKVEFSKTGQTIYSNGMAFKKMTGTVAAYSQYANFIDIESGEGYWISGVKKIGNDRHWAGGGKVMINKDIVDEYLELVDFSILDENYFELIEIKPTDKNKFSELENLKL